MVTEYMIEILIWVRKKRKENVRVESDWMLWSGL